MTMTKQMAVIPSEVEESRGESFELIPRGPSTPLRMMIHHSGFVIPSTFGIRHFKAACHPRPLVAGFSLL
jgi:hypothetical protein